MRSLISRSAKLFTSKSTMNVTAARSMSQLTSIPRKQERVRDHGYDDYMEIQKKVRKVLKFQELILTQPNSMISIAHLDNLSRRIGFKQLESGIFVLKFPHIERENEALQRQIPDAVTRIRKLLMMSKTGRIRLEHVCIARKDFGLPDDFEYSVILKHPQFFRLFDADEMRNKYIEMVERDCTLGACEIERVREREYRERGVDAEDITFSFVVNFPPGFKIGKYYKIVMWKWQRLPYWSPYEDVSGYDLRSLEAQRRMEKRAVAMIHELLWLTVEKKMTLERIAHFRMIMDSPKKLKEFMLQHQGIFYISTMGNHGKLHTVFLREAHIKGELVEPNELYLARRNLAELVLVSLRKARPGGELASYRRDGLDDHTRGWSGRDGRVGKLKRNRM
ncbi:Ubiquitin carboxyl-terminal hydrolase family protein [Perilla frutescens var. hirtella]|uniref:Ubiquitin carboxyl-terminal hydrolase family protein n=1 Tax=Perilla frutescens var. hirtella TaxID=608512 RepID=A0AAD4JL04_PERFH|nr:Ubiquitin carboxyl-terminal hydrolase family protein [Perilla frutescens var. hirtella]